MPLYKMKPVVIIATQFTGSNFDELAGITPGFRPLAIHRLSEDGRMLVAEVYDKLHDAWIPVANGDWIIKGLKGEFYPCEPVVFGQSYDPA